MIKHGKDAIVLVALLLLGLLIAAKLDWQEEPTFRGAFNAIDGDTLSAGRARLRLTGLDAPELAQRCGTGSTSWACGEAARRRLGELSDDPSLVCEANGKDRYRRFLVECRLDGGRGEDIAAIMVREGLATASDAHYLEEARARLAGRGIWSGAFERPADFRRDHGVSPQSPIENLIAAGIDWLRTLLRI